MMQRCSAIFLTVILLLMTIFPIQAYAAEPSKAVSCYYLEDAYYAAVKAGDATEPLQASFLINRAVVGEPQNAVHPDASQIQYLLLVDLSSSMRKNRKCVEKFADALLEEEPSAVTIAGFGDRFEVQAEQLTSQEEVGSALKKLKYDRTASNISKGIMEALDYQAKQSIEPGTLVNLILLTDGAPYVSGKDADAIEAAAKEAEEYIAAMPQVIMHTIYIGSSDPDKATKTAASAGTGVFLQIHSDTQEAEDAGQETADYIRSLSCFTFPVRWGSSEEKTEIQLRLSTKEFLTCSHVRDLAKQQIETESETADTENIDETEASSASETSDTAENTTDTTSETDENTQDTVATETIGNAPVQDDTASPVTESETTEEIPGSQSNTLLVVVIAVALTAVILAVVLMRKRRTGTAPSGSGIIIRMEVLDGKCSTMQQEFVLQQELLIGSSRSCDIVLKDTAVAPKNTRIFIKDQMICIEDLNSESVTQLAGMKIHAPNQLRSGDEIIIGNTRLRFLF